MSDPSQVQEITVTTPGVFPREVLAGTVPVLVRGMISHWPSVVAASASDRDLLDYLRSLQRDAPILAFRGAPDEGGRFFYNDDLTGFNFERVSTTLGRFLERMAAQEVEDHAYIGSSTVEDYFPGFNEQNTLDLGVATPLVSIWMGNQSRVAAHFDTPENVACVVSGRRRFTLFPPEQLPNLYVGPLDFTPAGQAISMVNFADPDFERFPRFREALAAAQVADMGPGDALYLPSMWWHHVEGLEQVNVLVNYWWSPAEGVSGNPMNALLHALMSIRGLPPEHRAAWRDLFDHYIFTPNGNEVAHIPEGRRGVLGKLDRSTLRQLRAMLRNALGG